MRYPCGTKITDPERLPKLGVQTGDHPLPRGIGNGT
jgi:hypothetical protein